MFKLKPTKNHANRFTMVIVAGVVASVASATVAFSSAAQVKQSAKNKTTKSAKAAAVAAPAANDKAQAQQYYNQCQNVTVVAHTGTNAEGANSQFDVDTTQWINHEIDRGHNRIELDLQVSSDGKGFSFHDQKLNQETRNGSGVVHTRPIKYLKGLKSQHGQDFATTDDLIRILKNNKRISFQHEFKDYDTQWTPESLTTWYNQMAAGGVLDQIHVSSASPRVLSWFHTNHPDMKDLQLIGFAEYLPDLDTAINVGANQVNTSSSAALDSYKGKTNYLSAARDRGLRTSVRSKPNGAGDNGQTWLKAIKFGADQIVTQGPNKAEVCNAVRKAAN